MYVFVSKKSYLHARIASHYYALHCTCIMPIPNASSKHHRHILVATAAKGKLARIRGPASSPCVPLRHLSICGASASFMPRAWVQQHDPRSDANDFVAFPCAPQQLDKGLRLMLSPLGIINQLVKNNHGVRCEPILDETKDNVRAGV